MTKSIPVVAIEWLVSREHVSVLDKDIEKLIRERTALNPDDWTETKIKQAVKHAIKTHHLNQDLFNHVMTGV